MIPFTVIGGYLGTGKTTLVNRLLKGTEGKRIALLINDFGKINIDAELIASQTQSQINLTNGCVCCTLSDGFHEAIERLTELDPPPDQIVVEASGVADVRKTAQYGHGPNMQLDGVLVLADAETVIKKASDKYVSQTIHRQLNAADLIILNKVDLVSKERLTFVLAWFKSNFPDRKILTSRQCQVPLPMILGIHNNQAGEIPTPEDKVHEHELYDTWAFSSKQPVSTPDLVRFIDELGADVIRAKGVVRLVDGLTVELQVVGSRRETIRSHDQTVQGARIIVIGLLGNLDKTALDELARIYLRGDG